MKRLIAVAGTLLAFAGVLVATAPSARADSVVIDNGTVHGGMYSSEWEATADLDAMTAWAGRKVTFAGTFQDIFESDPNCPTAPPACWEGSTNWILEHAWQAEATPVVNLTIPASAAAIAGGAYDTAIIAWANDVKAWTETPGGPQRTLFIAPLQEHNGHWVPYGCDPTNFKLAYARIRSLVQGVGLDETRVRWVWAPNGSTSNVGGCLGTTLADYYPGSDIVDVIGYSAYRGGVQSVYFAVAGVADSLRAIDPTKPYLVIQTGAENTGTRDQWIRDLFSWAANDENVVGLVWFNYDPYRIWNPATKTGLSQGWRDGMTSSSTLYTWPLTDWFQRGALVLDAPPGPCPDGAPCDTAVFVNGAGRWFRYDALAADDPINAFYFGNPGDVPFMGDWDCDGVKTPGLYRRSDGFVYLRNSNTQGVADISFFFGNPGDLPVAGDFDGDDCDTLSIYRPSEGRFFVINQLGQNNGGLGAAEYDFYFGNPGDNPFVGDFNGDGVDTIGLYRTTTGFVYFRNSLDSGVADLSFFYGDPGDKIVAGDWDGDGDDTVAVYRPGTGRFYVNFDNAAGNADYTVFVGYYVAAARG